MCNRYFQFLTIGLIIFALMGCHGDSPVAPDNQNANPAVSANNYASSHYFWGLWDVTIDPDTGEIEAVPMRTADFNANIVRFLQPPVAPINMLTIALGPGCEPSTGYWVIDVTLVHPFPGNNIFRGFDVRGIIMTEGDAAGIHDPGVSYRGLDGTRLLNADGYTRWWNMQEFTTYGKILGYTEGARSTPGFIATATVNPYKLFTDALDLEAPVNSINPDVRATFGVSPGINKRRYEMQFDLDGGTPPMRFKYAVDASWSLPDPSYAPDYPIQAYDLSANCQEPYFVEVPIFVERPFYESATLFGGDAVFLLTIGDWQADSGENVIDQLSHIWVESPTLIDAPIDVLPDAEFVESTHATMATYRVTVPDCHPTGLENQYFLITVESTAPDSYIPQIQGDPYAFDWPDAKLAAYMVVDVPINLVAPQFNFAWVRHAGGIGFDSGYKIATLSDNSVVVTGSFEDLATFGEGEPNETILEPEEHWDIFVARYKVNGDLDWVKKAGGISKDLSNGITSLADDSIVITGKCGGAAIFGLGEPNETHLEPDAHYLFIAKYNPDGSLEWVKGIESDTYSYGLGLISFPDNSVVVTGAFGEIITFGEGEPNETTFESYGHEDVFVARYISDGSFAWVKRSGGPGNDSAKGIRLLSDNSFVAGGTFQETAVFGEGEPNEATLTSYGNHDIFISKFSSDGKLGWVKQARGTYASYVQAITSLPDDSLVLTGYYFGTMAFGVGEPNETILDGYGEYDIFLAKYNFEGTLAWAKRAGATGVDSGYDVAALTDNSVLVIGEFQHTALFGQGEPNEASIAAYGMTDIFIARYLPDGALAWIKHAGAEGIDYGLGMSVLSDGSVVATGHFWGTAIFGEGEPNETTLETYGCEDIFIARYFP